MTPREVSESAQGYYEREKEEWRRLRRLAAEVINISQKSVKHRVLPEQLFKFPDEYDYTPPEEREARAKQNLKHLQSKFWTLFKRDEDGNPKWFDEEDYARLMEGKSKKAH